MLDAKTIEIVKSSAPVLKLHSHEIGKQFYEMLFNKVPDLLNLFNQSNQKRGIQQEALGYVVYAAGEHITDLESLNSVIRRISEKHRSLGIKADQYPIVGETLLEAVKVVLGDAATDEIIDAWGQAYGYIADAFIRLEDELYKEAESQPGGWSGFRRFIVEKKERETEEVANFYLKPEDGRAIPVFKAGQYLTIKAEIPGQPYTHFRHYSLSEAPGQNYFRISVKREDAVHQDPEGIVSHYLHDQVQEGDSLLFSAPAGDFILHSNERPVVLISGGIGITPLYSMLNEIVNTRPQREVTFVHATSNSKRHTFQTDIAELARTKNHVRSYVCYDSPTEEDRTAHLYDKEGRIDLDVLLSVKPAGSAEYYFCGSVPFMESIAKLLRQLNVPKEDIHYESFSPLAMLEED
ncbi:NO-inducible flavohemoprotein [Neobacillus mesonae]|nr:NO-inducible flavohemoprotein [Neobacillus mesonae]